MTTASPPIEPWLDGKIHRMGVRIYYEDTDLSGVVYHANYLRYFERGRSEFLRAAGFDHATLLSRPDPCAFAVTEMNIKFVRAAKIDDHLLLSTVWRSFSGVRMKISQKLTRGGETIATAEVEACTLTLDARARRPPRELVDALRPLMVPEPSEF
jgi:acyl-CoA thioester hydrolase